VPLQVLASLDDNMQRYGDMLSQQQRSTAVSTVAGTCHAAAVRLASALQTRPDVTAELVSRLPAVTQ
jgi:hypothetical protein